MSPDELERHLDNITKLYNHTGQPEFEGFSPYQMDLLIKAPLEETCPVQLKILQSHEYLQIPILNQAQWLLTLLWEEGKIKLTAKGFLPVKLVKELYAQGFMEDEYVEFGLIKIYREANSESIYLTRVLLDLGRLTKKTKELVESDQKG
jgi:hypothetical protein